MPKTDHQLETFQLIDTIIERRRENPQYVEELISIRDAAHAERLRHVEELQMLRVEGQRLRDEGHRLSEEVRRAKQKLWYERVIYVIAKIFGDGNLPPPFS